MKNNSKISIRFFDDKEMGAVLDILGDIIDEDYYNRSWGFPNILITLFPMNKSLHSSDKEFID
ncbi:MAG: hypothetical protein SO179_02490 [Bacteroidales bacterium]|nr:hypothetical protein [Bacteroidales bacterium]